MGVFIILGVIALIAIIVFKWVDGIEKYKDYKGEDFLN